MDSQYGRTPARCSTFIELCTANMHMQPISVVGSCTCCILYITDARRLLGYILSSFKGSPLIQLGVLCCSASSLQLTGQLRIVTMYNLEGSDYCRTHRTACTEDAPRSYSSPHLPGMQLTHMVVFSPVFTLSSNCARNQFYQDTCLSGRYY